MDLNKQIDDLISNLSAELQRARISLGTLNQASMCYDRQRNLARRLANTIDELTMLQITYQQGDERARKN